jgi:succinate dehydrogenase / fumarate reductase membrane anchor subunit
MSMQSKSSLRTPLALVRGLGSAKSGTGHFWKQRLTALALVPLSIAFICLVTQLAGADHGQAVAIVSAPLTGMLLLLFLLAGLVHMRIGMQVIIEDYVHQEGARVLFLMANTFFTIAVGLACVYAVLKISFGM